MKKTDDELIKDFFLSHKENINDNGFSEKVMRKIPGRDYKWGKIITLLSWIAIIMLFVLLGGINVIVGTFCDILTSQGAQDLIMGNLPKLALGILIFTGTVVYHIISEER